MAILLLILLVLFGFAPFSSTVEPDAARVEAPMPVQASAQAGTAVPAQLTIDGQPATALVLEPTSGEVRYAVVGESLYRADGSGGWMLEGAAPSLETTIVDSRNPGVLWAGTGLECYRGGGESAPLMRGTDWGASWAEAGPAGYVPLASWDPGDVVIAHDCSGLRVSRDGGATWAMPEGLPLGSQVTSFAVLSTPESAAGLEVLVGVTGEGGTSELYRVGLSDPAAAAVEGPLATWFAHAGLDVDASGAILLGAPQGVLRSDDRGQTWTTVRSGLETTTLEQDPIEVFPPDLEPGTFGLPALVASDQGTFVAGVDGVYRLNDTGDAWEHIGQLDAEVTRIGVEPGTEVVLVETAENEVLRVEVTPPGS